METSLVNNAKEGVMDTAYIVAGAFVASYAKGAVSKYTGFAWTDEVVTVLALVGAYYFKNPIVKNLMKGALIAGLLGLAKKYFGFSVL